MHLVILHKEVCMRKNEFFRNNFKNYIGEIITSGFLMMALTGCACTDNRRPDANKKTNAKDTDSLAMMTEAEARMTNVKEAIAIVHSLTNEAISGKIVFVKEGNGIRIVGDVLGLKPGKHGFHVHEHGDCGGKDGAAAGGHFNPTKTKHGGPDSLERHVGDLGNLVANERGEAHYDRVDTMISFEGENSILGRSIIIHADPDDYVTQPTGNSGARIACGIVEAVRQ